MTSGTPMAQLSSPLITRRKQRVLTATRVMIANAMEGDRFTNIG